MIKITIENEEKLISALKMFPRQVAKYMAAAGKEASKTVILPTQGLKAYPPATDANRPGRMKGGSRMAYYIRGRGTMSPTRGGGYKLNATSERYGTHWYTRSDQGGFSTRIGNPVSYAEYLGGDKQARVMGGYGWRKLREVARERIGGINHIYYTWVNKLLKDLKLD